MAENRRAFDSCKVLSAMSLIKEVASVVLVFILCVLVTFVAGSLSSCATPPVRTITKVRTVTVDVPVLQALNPELTNPVALPMLNKGVVHNNDLLNLLDERAGALKECNNQLIKIRDLQPEKHNATP